MSATTSVLDVATLSTSNFKKLTPAQIQSLSSEQIAALSAKKFANFSPEQLTYLSAEQIAAADISQLRSVQVDSLSANQLAAMSTHFSELSNNGLDGLSSKNLAGVSATQINSLTAEKIALLKPRQLNALSTTQISGLSDSTFGALSGGTLKALNFNLPASAIPILSPQQLSAFTAEKFSSFTSAQIAAITPVQSPALRSTQLAAFSAEQATQLTPETIAAINPLAIKAIKFNAFDSPDIAALTPRQIATLTSINVNQLATNAVGLSVEQINAFKLNSLKGLSSNAINALTTESLNAFHIRIPSITPDNSTPETPLTAQDFLKKAASLSDNSVMVNLTGASATDLSVISKLTNEVVDNGLLNLRLFTENQSDNQTVMLLSKAKDAVVDITNASTFELTTIVSDISHIKNVTGTGILTMKYNQFYLNSDKLGQNVDVRISDLQSTIQTNLNALLANGKIKNINATNQKIILNVAQATDSAMMDKLKNNAKIVVSDDVTNINDKFNELLSISKIDSFNIIGTSGDDMLTGSAGVDTMTGGDGTDKFIFNSLDLSLNTNSITDIISDFQSQIDNICLPFAATESNFYFDSTITYNTLSTLISAADEKLNGIIKIFLGKMNSASYLVTDDGLGHTNVIQLVGVTNGIVFSDVIAN